MTIETMHRTVEQVERTYTRLLQRFYDEGEHTLQGVIEDFEDRHYETLKGITKKGVYLGPQEPESEPEPTTEELMEALIDFILMDPEG